MSRRVTLEHLLTDAQAQLRQRRRIRSGLCAVRKPKAAAVADRRILLAEALVAHLETASAAR